MVKKKQTAPSKRKAPTVKKKVVKDLDSRNPEEVKAGIGTVFGQRTCVICVTK